MIQFFNAFNCRSLRHSLFKLGPFTKRWLLLAITWEIILLSLVIYVPFLQNVFHTYALSLRDWIISLLLASSIFVVMEIAKMVIKLRNSIAQPSPAS